jgi:hypothetical protein
VCLANDDIRLIEKRSLRHHILADVANHAILLPTLWGDDDSIGWPAQKTIDLLLANKLLLFCM